MAKSGLGGGGRRKVNEYMILLRTAMLQKSQE
jgi:hypothetical protein